MPDLPTITVTTEVQARIMAALGARYETTDPAVITSEYKKWLAKTIKSFVLDYERQALDTNFRTSMAALRADIESTIDESGL